MIKKFRILLFSIAALSAAGLLLGCGSGNKEGGAGAATSTTIPPDGNITASIQSVSLAQDGSGHIHPVVTFSLFDQNSRPLDPTSSGLSARFTIARLQDDGSGDFYYKNYIKTSTATQPGFDSGGTFATVGNGLYTYTFGTDITDATKTLGGITFDNTKTHTVAGQIQRTIPSLADGNATFQQAANPYLTFSVDPASGRSIPNSGPTREVVAVSDCNECHGLLNAHGGGRRDVALCILCHYPGVIDPDSTNTIDFKYLIHKIHMGDSLPSNVAGGNFTIIGFGGSVNSFATVTFPFISGVSFASGTPMDCVKCHRKGTDLTGKAYGNDVDKWKQAPKIATCTTCHDTTVFDTSTTVTIGQSTVPAVPHTGGVDAVPGTRFTLDTSCTDCHTDNSEFASATHIGSAVGAHTVIEKSSLFVDQATGVEDINFQILSVTNATPGNKPTVTFRVTDKNGTAYTALTSDPSGISTSVSFNLKLGYMPVVDYQNNNMNNRGQPLTQPLGTSTYNGDGTWTITFATAIPAGAAGIGVIGIEGRAQYSYQALRHTNALQTVNARIGGMAQQYYFDLATGAKVTDPTRQRRQVVDVGKCKLCHSRLSLHGGNRVNNPQECVICHNPDATDGATPEQPIDFKVMIHKIHTGEDLTIKPYIVNGTDFSDVTYPRDRRDCLGCHLPGTYGIPLRAGVLGTTISSGANLLTDTDNTRLQPMTSVCTACHDDHLSHAETFTDPTAGELCLNCHAAGILQTSWDIAHRPIR